MKARHMPLWPERPIDFMLANEWDGRNPDGLLMSEKLDGVRAMWDGYNLFTRGGNVIAAPAWWTDRLPRWIVLDGELWAGRGRFQFVKGAIQRKLARDEDWREIRLMAFDAPFYSHDFERRARLLNALAIENDSIVIVSQNRCNGVDHLSSFFSDIVSSGGEGVMLRDPCADYQCFRSDALLKVKPGNKIVDEMIIGRRAA